MKLSFLIQLVLFFLLVMCVYLVFTNKVEGRMKLIIIIFCVVIGLYLYSKLNIFTDYNEYYPVPESAKEEYFINKDLLKKSDGQFAISVWVFIDDWNYRYGEKKIILKKTMPTSKGSMNLPSIELDPYKNDLIIRLDTFKDGSDSYEDALVSILESNGISVNTDNSDVECSGGFIYVDETKQISGGSDISCGDATIYDDKDTIVENINMQKWVNIITTISNRSLDIYINGKLIKTKTFNNLIDVMAFNDGGITLTPGGGFGGFISKVRYYPYYITPQQAWNIYKDGFGDAFESALNKYNLSVSLYEDRIEQNKFYLF